LKPETLNTPLLEEAHRAALAGAGRLRLPLRSRVWKGQAGEFLGAGVGSSLDFQDHRTYVPGDDPRHINWQAYARTGNYTMKLYREEVRPVVDLVFDVSHSMFYTPAKARRSLELLYLAAESAIQSGAALAVHAALADSTLPLHIDELRSHRWPDRTAALAPSDPAAPLKLGRVAFRANAVRVLVSDLLFPGDPEPILRTLTARHGSAIILCPFLADESRPDWSGNCDFIDAETARRHPHRIDPSVLRRYHKAYDTHFTLWKQSSRRHQTSFARISCHADLLPALFAEALPAGALEASD
jgi:uncharacterized protein (DUF58 family)